MIPGLGLLGYAGWHLLADKAVGPIDIETGSGRVVPGERLAVSIRFTPPKPLSISAVTATLRGREWCVRGSGKQRKVAKQLLHERLFELLGKGDFPAGLPVEAETVVELPRMDAFSFASTHNRVSWELELRIAIPTWPDWTRKIPLQMVAPEPKAESGADAPVVRAAPPIRVTPLDPIPEPPPLPPPPPPLPPPSPLPPASEPPVAAVASVNETQDVAKHEHDYDYEHEHEHEKVEPSAPQVSVRDELSDLLQRISSADRFSGAREALVGENNHRVFDFQVLVQGIEWSLGMNTGKEYRGGRMMVGKLGETGPVVAVHHPQPRNKEVDAIPPGTRVSIRGRLVEWSGLHDRGAFEAI